MCCLFLSPPVCCMYLIFILVFLQRAEHLKEIRKLAKQAVAKRIGKRVVKYKNRLRKNLPSQIKIWSEREKRLLAVITGSAGSRLMRCLCVSALIHLRRWIRTQTRMKQKRMTKLTRYQKANSMMSAMKMIQRRDRGRANNKVCTVHGLVL